MPRGEALCADCVWALAQHPDPRVRLALVTQPRIPPDVLELLVADPDPLVADRAERTAAFRGVPVKAAAVHSAAGSRALPIGSR